MRNVHEISKIATGVKACDISVSETFPSVVTNWALTYLEHLDVSNTQVEVRCVAENQATREQQAYRQDGAEEHVLRHTYILDAVQQIGRLLQYPCTDRCESQMESDKENGVLKIEGVVEIIVVDNDR